MFVIYANSEDEKNSKNKKPEDYLIKDNVAKMLFQAGCALVKEESDKRTALLIERQKRFEAIHPELRSVSICKQRST